MTDLPRLPAKPPEGLAVRAVLDCGQLGHAVICEAGAAYMLVRAGSNGDDRPLTPLLTRDEIAAVAEAVLAADMRVVTWPLLPAVLALGTLLADVPPGGPQDDAEPPPVGGGPDPAAPAAAAAVPRPAEAGHG